MYLPKLLNFIASNHQQQPLVVDVHQNHPGLTSSLQHCHTDQQHSQALVLTAPVSQQQLQPINHDLLNASLVFQAGDKTTNVTYNFGKGMQLASSYSYKNLLHWCTSLLIIDIIFLRTIHNSYG